MMKILILLVVVMASVSCSHLASVSQTSIPAQKGKEVKATAHKNIILGFTFSNTFVDQVMEQLAQNCPNGSIKGILTKHEKIVYFPIVFHQDKVTAQGYCNE